jgi:hypothetical protein
MACAISPPPTGCRFRKYERAGIVAVVEDAPECQVIEDRALDICFFFLLVVHELDGSGVWLKCRIWALFVNRGTE